MLVKRVLDTQIAQVESIGAAKILASLSSDTSHISTAFLSLPHAVYGAAVCLGAFGYLAWLSLPLFGATIAWLVLTAPVAYRPSRHAASLRPGARGEDDRLRI